MSCPPEIANRLAMQRESFLHGEKVQAWVAGWWRGINMPDRRTLLALAGLDESEANARRPWDQYLQADRDALLAECKRMHRLTAAVKWA